MYFSAQVKRIRILNILYRLILGIDFFKTPLKNLLIWLFASRETTNFTYDLEPLNIKYLSSFVSIITNTPISKVQDYIKEIETDTSLKKHIKKLTSESEFRFYADKEAKYGRRIGWYAFIRALKPEVVVETGSDKGLGSCVIASALIKNAEEGFNGYLYTIDINTKAGYLFKEPYNRYGEILYGDSVEILKNMEDKIDIFIHDSDHLPDYELSEYLAITDKLSSKSIIISDNAHSCAKLWEYAIKNNKKFLYFQEKPVDHWYTGAGIGVCF